MIARLALISLAASTVVYLCLRKFLLDLRRDRLTERWDADADPTLHIRHEMEAYERRLRWWLIGLVYVLPLGAIIVFVAVTND
jgi:hypothetical protein